MHLYFKICLFFVVWLSTRHGNAMQAAPEAQPAVSTPKQVLDFFQAHCVVCHSSEVKESTFRIDDSLEPRFQDAATKARWEEIVNVLNSHQMPPEDRTPPAPDEVASVVDWITNQIILAERTSRQNQVVMRRLNRIEYRNSVRELTGVEVDVSRFPLDPSADGFDNIGSALTFSPMQMEIYLESANHILAQALVDTPKPDILRWRFEIDSGSSDSNRIRIDKQNPIVNGGNNPVVDGFKFVHHNNWDKKLNVRDFALPHDGPYMVRIRAAGKIPKRDEVIRTAMDALQGRFEKQMAQDPKKEKWHRHQLESDLEHFSKDPMYDYGPPRLKLIQDLAGQPRTVTEFDVAAPISQPETYEIPVSFTTQRAGLTIEYAYSIPSVLENFLIQNSDGFARPELYVDWIEIEGPIHPEWPPRSHRLLIPEPIDGKNEKDQIEKIIGRFVRKAFRRPVSRGEVAPYLDIYDQARKERRTIIQSLRTALAAVLVSPHFLYIVETQPPSKASEMRHVNSYQLATRLSYFLWSGPPDTELLDAAKQSKLDQSAALSQQVARMLKDDRSEQLITNFVDQWLGLRQVGANPPAPDLYPHYDRHLELSMIEEGRALFRTILREERPLLDLIDPGYVVINERLARFYEIPDIRGDHFRIVSLPPDHPRGGVLTQAAMLTITSNGTRTSPVKRGTWILKNVLGTDPGLPVANAGDIAPKVPGIDKATVRQRLEIHRQLPQCGRCHAKIDPLGLALENFNASGQFRLQEGFGYKGRIQSNDPKIDASAKLPDGTYVDGPAGLRRAVRQQEESFLHCLSQKMMTYALGRQITLADEPAVREILNKTKAANYRLKALIEAIVLSEPFQSW